MHQSALKYGKLFFETYCKKKHGATVVDIGAQNVNGSLKDVCPEHMKYVGVDFAEGSEVDIILDDPYKLPFDDNSVDIIVCSSVFEHSQFFWLLFVEIIRVLKANGLFYLNVPSNGSFHRYPVDCWRFYPDSGHALAEYAQREGFPLTLIESFVGKQSEGSFESGAAWHDYVAIFYKSTDISSLPNKTIIESIEGYTNGYLLNGEELSSAFISPDHSEIIKIEKILSEKDAELSEKDAELSEKDAQLACLSAQLYGIKASTGWRLLAPLHWYGRQRDRIKRLLSALPHFRSKVGGWRPLVNRGLTTWRQDGLIGLRAQMSRQIVLAREQAVSTDAAEVAVADYPQQIPSSTIPEILFVSHDASRTGAPVFFISLIRQLKAELGISCVILLGRGGELEAEFKELGPTFIQASHTSMDPVVLHALKQRKIRLVYVNSVANGALITALTALQKPILCHVHELAYSIEKIFGAKNLRQTLEGTDCFLAGSGAVAAYLTKHVPQERIALAHPFIDQASNQHQASNQPPPLELPPNAVVIGGCGTVGWRKGTDIFIQMAREVIAKVSRPVVFVWVGGPLSYGEFAYLPYDIHQFGLSEQLIMTGSVSAHIPYLAQFDIFVLPSREDPFPLVVLDAASLGKPVVCFAQAGGSPELIEQDAGFVVPYLNLSAMTAAVVQLVEDSDLRQQMGTCGQHKITERHDTTPGLAKIARIVQDALHSEREDPP